METDPQHSVALPVLRWPEVSRPGTYDRRQRARRTGVFRLGVAGVRGRWRGIDLSVAGLLCVCHEPLWPGNGVQLEVSLGGDTAPLNVAGQVVQLVTVGDELGMRVVFDKVGHDHARRLRAWVEQEVSVPR